MSYLQLPEIQQVRPRLFIGTQHAASQKKLLKELEITHIISMNGSTPLWPGDFQYQTLFTTDDDDSMLLEHMLEAIHFMESALVNGGNVLVHCSRGVNRSGAMLIGYLMMSEGLSYSEVSAAFAFPECFFLPQHKRIRLTHLSFVCLNIQKVVGLLNGTRNLPANLAAPGSWTKFLP